MRFPRLWLLALITMPGPAMADSVSWSRYMAQNGQKIGYSKQEIRQTAQGRYILQASRMEIKEQDNPRRLIIESTTRVEDFQGRTQRIEALSSSGRDRTRVSVQIVGNVAKLIRTTRFDTQSNEIALPPSTRFDGGNALLADWDMTALPQLEFYNFSATTGAVERVIVQQVKTADLPDGQILLSRLSFDGPNLRSVAEIVLGSDRRLIESRQPMLGTSITIERSDEAAAIKSAPPFSVIRNVMIKSPYRISSEARAGHIRYVFAFQDGVDFPLPQTGEQRVRIADGKAVIDICATCGGAQAPTSEELAASMRPALWMQSESKLVMQLTKSVRASRASPAEKMATLAVIARKRVKDMDFSGHYSALETLRRRAGDCTEDAVVLATLGRAVGIPTRVVSGLLYSREDYHGVSNVFMPHSWTLAWIEGKWQSFDMSVNGFDATHIALTIGDGDSRSIFAASQLASRLGWEKMIQVKAVK